MSSVIPDLPTLVDVFRARVRAAPEAPALRGGGASLSYADLEARASAIARGLADAGVEPGSLVGLCMERSVEVPVAVLGTLMAGCAYVPLDPVNPAPRLELIAGQARPVAVVADRASAEVAGALGIDLILPVEELTEAGDPDGDGSGPVDHRPEPEDLAYVIFTSGSTGVPKGVEVTHRNVVRLLTAAEARFDFGPDDVWLLFHSYAFDFSVWEMWGAWGWGGTLVVPGADEVRRPDAVEALLEREGVTVFCQTPSAFRALTARAGAVESVGQRLRWIVFGGERLNAPALARWIAVRGDERPALVNMYGITETTVHVTWRRIRADDAAAEPTWSPIGEPLADLSVSLLDESGHPVVEGEVGEMYVSGPGLARGYLGRPDLTAERFVDDGVGGRMYRTGDLARRVDGELLFEGRVDDQIQLRGYRIELGEVEAAARGAEGVADVAATTAALPGSGEDTLVAWVVAEEGRSRGTVVDAVRRRLERSLPSYMVPALVRTTDALPLTANGKVDRDALPDPFGARPELMVPYVPPSTPTERLLAEIWAMHLGVAEVGTADPFFDLGGTSVVAAQVVAALSQALGREVPVLALFENPSIEPLAAMLDRTAEGADRVAASRTVATGRQGRRWTGEGAGRVAVVGMAVRVPGADDVAGFWSNLLEGVEAIVDVTAEDLSAAGLEASLLDDPSYVPRAAPIDGVEDFDARFFGYVPADAELIDPQQRLFLELVWNALEDAGCDPRSHPGVIGVFGGVGRNDYLTRHLAPHPEHGRALQDLPVTLGNEKDFPATRAAFKLDLRGPAVNVQTACSTSGVATHLAVRSLADGECDVAVVAGCRILLPTRAGYRYHEGGVTSRSGHLAAFGAGADGMVRGSGGAAVVLKRLDDARADGDTIHAVVLGTAVNNDGASKIGYTAPSAAGQEEVVAMALARAGVDPATVGYVEAHGTGTALGDPIEVAGLTGAWRRWTDRTGYCRLGSVKSNVGHLDAGAFVTGLVKTALALREGVIPATLHAEEPHPGIDFGSTPFVVAGRRAPWPRGETPRRAAISAFGLGGTNAHAVLEEAPGVESKTPPDPPGGAHLLVLSARSSEALDVMSARLADRLESEAAPTLGDAAHTLRRGRSRFDVRRSVVARDPAEAAARLRCGGPGVRTGRAGRGRADVVYLLPGGGAAYPGMARGLSEAFPDFRAAVRDGFEAIRAGWGVDLEPWVWPVGRKDGDAARALERPSVQLPALFVVEVALARLWTRLGVGPDALLGHSLGENTAAHLAGVLGFEDALGLVRLRGELLERVDGGKMLSVSATAEELDRTLPPDLGRALDVAVENAPDARVLAGPEEVVAEAASVLRAAGLEARRVPIAVAAHSRLLDPVLDEFRSYLEAIRLEAPGTPILSNRTGTWLTDGEATDPGYWVEQFRHTVRFSACVQVALGGRRVFLEVGPGRTLGSLVRAHAPVAVAASALGHADDPLDDVAVHLDALGHLWTAGVEPPWDAVAPARGARKASLPTYPFERDRHWVEASARPAAPAGGPDPSPAVGGGAGAGREGPREGSDGVAPGLPGRVAGLVTELSGLPAAELLAGRTFLELGFDSLFLTRIARAVRDRFGVRVGVRALMETHTSVPALAEWLEAEGAGDVAPEPTGDAPDPSTAGVSGDDAGSPFAVAGRTTTRSSPWQPPDRGGSSDGLGPRQREHVAALVERLTRRTPASKAWVQEHRDRLADPRTVQGFRAAWKEMVYPIVSDRADGARIHDLDGNEYIDLVGGYGVTFFGHRPPFIQDAVRAQLDRTVAIGPQTPLAGEVSALVCELTGMERAAFCNTGSEAVLAAIRTARTVTGRPRIALFSGHYHGIFDEVLVRSFGGLEGSNVPIAPGIPAKAVGDVLVLEYGDPASFEVLRRHAGEIALCLVEPVRSRNPAFQPWDYLRALREVTEDAGIPLLFDEMITGFRSHPGGVQHLAGVRADLATYGKVVGGGFPIGVVAGSRRFLDALDGGHWRYGDDSRPEADMTWFAGTFVRHPLALAAARAVLQRMRDEGPALQQGVDGVAASLVDGLNELFERRGAAFEAERFSSVFYLRATGPEPFSPLLFHHLHARGVYTYEGRPGFLTTAHTHEDMARVLEAFDDSLRALQTDGLLSSGKDSGAVAGEDHHAVGALPDAGSETIALSPGQQEIWLNAVRGPEASCAYNLCSTVRFSGELDLDALQAGLDALVARHEALRARPANDGRTQRIVPEAGLPLRIVDCTATDAVAARACLDEARHGEVTTPFDLEGGGALVRATLVRLSAGEAELLLTVHHVVCDGWSCGVLLRNLGELYSASVEGRAPVLPERVTLREWVADEEARRRMPDWEESLAFWRERLREAPASLDLPTDRPRPATKSFPARRLGKVLPPDEVARIRSAASSTGSTLFVVLLAGFHVLVHRLTGADDLVVASSLAGQTRWPDRDLVGHCVTFLPVRTAVRPDDTFGEHTRVARGAFLDALEHQHCAFGELVRSLAPPRDRSRVPLAQVAFNLDPSGRGIAFSGVEAEVGSVPREFETMDAFFNVVERPDGALDLQCTANTDLFDAERVDEWLARFRRILLDAVDDPSMHVAGS
ncbi:MAG: amino acid adenylation domain-containing protein [Longimicrobiales bacterium]